MMRQNLALVLIVALGPLAHAGTKKPKRLQELKTTQSNWEDLMSDDQLEDEKPKRQVVRVPPSTKTPPTPVHRPPARSSAAVTSQTGEQLQRKPASVQPMQLKPSSAFPVAAITFEEYMAENARNPALSKLIPDHQVAFQDTTGIAYIPMDNSDGAAEPVNGVAGQANPAAMAGANPAAIQAAAAAAAAAGLIPAGTSLPGAAGSSSGSSSSPQPIR